MSKFFQVPQDIEVRPWKAMDVTVTGEKVSFLKYATFSWLDDPRAYTDGQQGSIVKMKRWQKVIEKFEAAKPGDFLELEDQDWTTLKKLVEAPGRFFPTPVVMACMAFSDAVLNAKDEKPALLAESQPS